MSLSFGIWEGKTKSRIDRFTHLTIITYFLMSWKPICNTFEEHFNKDFTAGWWNSAKFYKHLSQLLQKSPWRSAQAKRQHFSVCLHFAFQHTFSLHIPSDLFIIHVAKTSFKTQMQFSYLKKLKSVSTLSQLHLPAPSLHVLPMLDFSFQLLVNSVHFYINGTFIIERRL